MRRDVLPHSLYLIQMITNRKWFSIFSGTYSYLCLQSERIYFYVLRNIVLRCRLHKRKSPYVLKFFLLSSKHPFQVIASTCRIQVNVGLIESDSCVNLCRYYQSKLLKNCKVTCLEPETILKSLGFLFVHSYVPWSSHILCSGQFNSKYKFSNECFCLESLFLVWFYANHTIILYSVSHFYLRILESLLVYYWRNNWN